MNANTNIVFAEQAEKYLTMIANRKRKPARANTLASYRSILTKRILPIVGGMRLADINNGVAKLLAGRLAEEGLSPASIRMAITLMIQVVDSAVDSDGKRRFPVEWNWDFIDAPEIESQKAPIVGVKALSEAISATQGEVKALIALLAGTGLRIGEALALGVGKGWEGNIWDSEEGTIAVKATRVGSEIQQSPKTKAGNRVVDLAPELNEFLKKTFSGVSGPLFIHSEDTYRRALAGAGICGGFHSLRRFRETYLESNNVPRMLMKFWTGHAANDITERYIKIGSQIEERKKWSAQAGIGFSLA